MKIKTLKSRDSHPEIDEKIIYESEIRQLEADYKEAIEAMLIIVSRFQSIVPTNTKYIKEYQDEFLKNFDIQIKVIEKFYNDIWENIRGKS